MAANDFKKNSKRIGIMGGTFDPIHYGHLLAAEEASYAFDLEKVIFIPAGCPPHKKGRKVAPAEDRFIMVLLAILDNPKFSVSKIEMYDKSPVHTVDTIKKLRKIYPDGQGYRLYFITGLDAILSITSWKDPFLLAKLCRFIAVTRPGYNIDDIKKLPFEIRSVIDILEIPLLAISSTEIRNRIREGRCIKYLLPPLVESYIYRRMLYKEALIEGGNNEEI